MLWVTLRFEPNKLIVFLTSRVHPGETPASFGIKGAIDFLLDEKNPQAELLRSLFVFKVVPMINPDGVIRGHFRSDGFGKNLNRYYRTPTLDEQPAVFAICQLINYFEIDKRIFFFCDFHAHGSCKDHFFYGNSLGFLMQVESRTFAKIFEINNPNFSYECCDFSQKQMLVKESNPLDKERRSKEQCSRVATYRYAHLIHSFTLELGYHGPRRPISPKDYHSSDEDMKKVIPAKVKPAAPRMSTYYTTKCFEQIGKDLLISLLDLFERNPDSKITSLAEIRREIASDIKRVFRKREMGVKQKVNQVHEMIEEEYYEQIKKKLGMDPARKMKPPAKSIGFGTSGAPQWSAQRERDRLSGKEYLENMASQNVQEQNLQTDTSTIQEAAQFTKVHSVSMSLNPSSPVSNKQKPRNVNEGNYQPILADDPPQSIKRNGSMSPPPQAKSSSKIQGQQRPLLVTRVYGNTPSGAVAAKQLPGIPLNQTLGTAKGGFTALANSKLYLEPPPVDWSPPLPLPVAGFTNIQLKSRINSDFRIVNKGNSAVGDSPAEVNFKSVSNHQHLKMAPKNQNVSLSQSATPYSVQPGTKKFGASTDELGTSQLSTSRKILHHQIQPVNPQGSLGSFKISGAKSPYIQGSGPADDSAVGTTRTTVPSGHDPGQLDDFKAFKHSRAAIPSRELLVSIAQEAGPHSDLAMGGGLLPHNRNFRTWKEAHRSPLRTNYGSSIDSRARHMKKSSSRTKNAGDNHSIILRPFMTQEEGVHKATKYSIVPISHSKPSMVLEECLGGTTVNQ